MKAMLSLLFGVTVCCLLPSKGMAADGQPAPKREHIGYASGAMNVGVRAEARGGSRPLPDLTAAGEPEEEGT